MRTVEVGSKRVSLRVDAGWVQVGAKESRNTLLGPCSGAVPVPVEWRTRCRRLRLIGCQSRTSIERDKEGRRTRPTENVRWAVVGVADAEAKRCGNRKRGRCGPAGFIFSCNRCAPQSPRDFHFISPHRTHRHIALYSKPGVGAASVDA